MVVAKKLMAAGVLLVMLGACRSKQNATSQVKKPLRSIASAVNDTTATKTGSIIARFNNNGGNETPVALLKNISVYCDSSQSFVLPRDTKLRVCGVGELVRALALVKPPYFLGNDDLELFVHAAGKDHRRFLFNWVEGYVSNGDRAGNQITLTKQFDTAHLATDFLITIPWKELEVQPEDEQSMDFDMAIGDNDDGIRQEGKIAWHAERDPLPVSNRNYGKLVFTSRTDLLPKPGVIYSVCRNGAAFSWNAVPAISIDKVVAGEVKDKGDCSAQLRSSWDKQNLYFIIRVYDSFYYYEERFISNVKAGALKTLCDYGYIEDQTGRVVWQMTALNTAFAGGSIKNRMVDTMILLKAGKYKLKYTSDESHAYGHWDADPPLTSFYGITVSSVK